ncbi:hypothetical protein [Thiosocius teredinicola]|uniref:hypothetical protein n=1 Tax=Thiosocius teredinicola TaxID=1973002 RepID=UPI0009911F05
MKHFIAIALLASTGLAQASSFDYEKAVGAPELFSTLVTDQVTHTAASSAEFSYQRSIGSDDLFSTLNIQRGDTHVSNGPSAFEYQLSIGSSELDPSLS